MESQKIDFECRQKGKILLNEKIYKESERLIGDLRERERLLETREIELEGDKGQGLNGKQCFRGGGRQKIVGKCKV